MSNSDISKTTQRNAGALKRFLRACGVMSLYGWLMRDRRNKLRAEMDFQREWAQEFRSNTGLVLECWRKYRHFDDIVNITRLGSSSTVLDIGCGISTVLHFVPGQRFGIDPLADEYKRIYDYPKDMRIEKSQGEHIPFATGFFDVVFCTNVLDHVANPPSVLAEVKRILKPEGYFVLAVEVFPESTERDPCHPHCFTVQMVEDLAIETGFKKIFERMSPWFGLRNYVKGVRSPVNEEIIMILQQE